MFINSQVNYLRMQVKGFLSQFRLPNSATNITHDLISTFFW
jgi:hypothetical protein